MKKNLKTAIFTFAIAFLFSTVAPITSMASSLPLMVQSVTVPSSNAPVNAVIRISFKSAFKTGDTLYIKDKGTSAKAASKTTVDPKNRKLVNIRPNTNLAYGRTYQIVLVSNKTETILFTFVTAKKPVAPAASGAVKQASAPEPIDAYAKKDSDGDGLSDLWEIYKYRTDPNKADSDGDGIQDSDWNERREYTYSVRTVMWVRPPYDINNMNDDFQDAKLVKEENGHLYFELITYPENEINKNFNDWKENYNWYNDNQKNPELQQYLKPGIATNWDEALRTKIIGDLKSSGIDISTMSDKNVVKNVSSWLIKKKIKYEGMFPTEFLVQAKDGQLLVEDNFLNAFHAGKDKNLSQFGYGQMSDNDYISHIIRGKEMYNAGIRQTCSSTATLISTVFKAIGIPSRIILTYTSYDFSNYQEVNLANNLQNSAIKNKILKSYLPGSSGDHFYNEVYVGGRWIRLNEDDFGDNVITGMEGRVRVFTASDYTDFNMSDWFRNDGILKEIPYHALEMSDMYGKHMDEASVKKINTDVSKVKETYNKNLFATPSDDILKDTMAKTHVMDCSNWVWPTGAESGKYNMIAVLDDGSMRFSPDMELLFRDMKTTDKNYINVKIKDGKLLVYVKAESSGKLSDILSKLDDKDFYLEQYKTF